MSLNQEMIDRTQPFRMRRDSREVEERLAFLDVVCRLDLGASNRLWRHLVVQLLERCEILRAGLSAEVELEAVGVGVHVQNRHLGRFDWTDGEGVGVGRCDGEGEHGVVAVSLQQLDAHDARARAGREPDLRLMRVRLEQSLVDATAAANWPTALVRNVFGLRLYGVDFSVVTRKSCRPVCCHELHLELFVDVFAQAQNQQRHVLVGLAHQNGSLSKRDVVFVLASDLSNGRA
mmetsp:Transcript_25285/g.55272  ORF Transcript_25285/g.55272 Transcript_25285/m.55272 type:complete len:233 (+) Transcript_25285:470-1168(+)